MAQKKYLDGAGLSVIKEILDEDYTLTAGTGIEINEDNVIGLNGENISNPNLLINPDFKINQRGKSEYITGDADNIYTADMWVKAGAMLTMTIYDDYISLTRNTADRNPSLYQKLDNANIEGKTVTLSIMYKASNTNGGVRIMSGNDNLHYLPDSEEWKIESFSFVLNRVNFAAAQNALIACVQVTTSVPVGGQIDIKWMKLELGSVATPFISPNPLTEKIKCGIPDDTSEYGYRAIVNATTVGGYTLGGNISTNDIAKLSATNIAYGTCDTAAATAAKVVTITGNTNWKLAVGSEITVKFTNTNTASNCTLNVNSTGAKKIWYNNVVYTGNNSMVCGYADRYIKFMYDGTNWIWMGHSLDLNNWTAASATANGYVTTGAQTFAGDKTFNGNVNVTGNITATGNITGDKVYNAIWNADYAEGFDYEGPIPEPGQIVELCGNNKIKIASTASNNVIGVCSESYWALAGCKLEEIENKTKVAIGLVGQLPIQIEGEVKFGDYIVCGGNGIGVVNNNPQMGQIIGRAMESNSTPELKSVNCIIQTH